MSLPDEPSAKPAPVSSIMTRVIRTIPPETPVRDLVILGSEEGCGDLPITTPEGIFLGVITPLDLIGSILPSIGVHSGGSHRCITCHLKKEGATAREIMSRGHITIHQDDSVINAMKQMERNRHGDLIVTDDAGRVTGRIEICHIIRHLRLVGEL